MRRLTLPAIAIVIAACLAAPAGHATTGAPAEKPAGAQRAALTGFQRDLVSVLALRAEAQPLLGAALLARTLPGQPKTLDFHHLVTRAAATADSDAAVTWAQLADCDAKAQTCPNADALAKLKQQAPDNAAVWLLALGQDEHDVKYAAAQADLARAAATTRYDDYAGASLQALALAVATLPPPPATLDADGPLASSPSGVQAMIVFGVAGSQPLPGFQAAAQLCAANADHADIRAQCLQLGKTLEWGSSALARSLGLHLRETLSTDSAAQAGAKNARRDLIWQVQNFTRLTARAQTDPAVAQRLLGLARHGGTEMSVMLAALRASGIPAEAPTGWQPHKK